MDQIDIVLTALVGYSGLLPTIRAIEAGKTIALANKETLVVAGEMITKLAQEKGLIGAVVFNVRFHEASQHAKGKLADPAFGPIRLLQPPGILSRKHGRPRWRTGRDGTVGIRKAYALIRYLINIGSRYGLSIITAQMIPGVIIGHQNQKVGHFLVVFFLFYLPASTGQYKNQYEKKGKRDDAFHDGR